MSCDNVLERLVKNGTVSTVLTAGKSKKTEITEFQKILHQLGFDAELKWSNYGADGYYGGACTAAVSAYCKKNGISSDGKTVTEAIANSMIARYDSLDELQELAAEVAKGNTETRLYKGCNNKVAVAAMQTLLNDLGYGEHLNWAKYRNDGDYGSGTTCAVLVFGQKNGINSDGTKLIMPIAQKILDALAPHYGADYAKNAKAGVAASAARASSGGSSSSDAMTTFTASNFTGKAVTCDVLFVPYLEKVNEYAKANNVKIYVTSSYREDSNVNGAIVVPAKKSNHMAGHAIDMNISFNGGFANSSYLKDEANWNKDVKGFIDAIRADGVLRWGGDFNTPDVVHIDDKLNLRDPAEWEKRYIAMQEASVNG